VRQLSVCILAIALGGGAHAQQPERDVALQQLRAGQQALHSERFEEAERAFKSAIELDSRLELAHYGLGQTFMATRRYVEAVQAFSRCQEVFRANDADRLANNVDADRRLDDQIRSLRDEKRSLESGRLQTANLAAKLNQIDSEISQLEGLRRRGRTAASATPPYILVALGSAHFRTGSFEQAEQQWRAALEAQPRLGEVHNNLAVLYMVTNRLDLAEQEVALAEKTGFNVSPQLKADLKSRRVR
jgi:tetratricopeptide (TPR) repeat protein